jgi:hypothetical protein
MMRTTGRIVSGGGVAIGASYSKLSTTTGCPSGLTLGFKCPDCSGPSYRYDGAAKVDALKSAWPDFAAMRRLVMRFHGIL